MATPPQRVLRIAIIQDKHIQQERLIKPGEPVTIGSDPTANTFVVPDNAVLGKSFLLFDTSASGYALRFSSSFGPKSKVTIDGTPTYLCEIPSDVDTAPEEHVEALHLSDTARGRLELGSLKILFQFVPAPVSTAVRSIETMDFRPKMLEDDDPVFLGFLALWSAMAVVLAIWVTRAELPVYEIDDYPDRFTELRIPIRPEPTPTPELPPTEEEVDVPAPEKPPEKPVPAKPEAAAPEPPPSAAERVAAARAELESNTLVAALIGTKGDTEGAPVEGVFGSDSGIGDVEEALIGKTRAVTDAGTPGIRGTGSTDLQELATLSELEVGGAGGTATVKNAPKVKVVASVGIGAGTVDSEAKGDSGKVRSIVRRHAGQMKYCYESRLKANPGLEGRVELSWYVEQGSVTGAPYVVSNSTGDSELGSCMVKNVKHWDFPDDVEGDIQWPWRFSAKK